MTVIIQRTSVNSLMCLEMRTLRVSFTTPYSQHIGLHMQQLHHVGHYAVNKK